MARAAELTKILAASEPLELLSTLSCRVSGAMLRRVRLMQLRGTLSFRFVYLWIRAFGSPESTPNVPFDRRDGEGATAPRSQGTPRLREVESRTA